MNFFSKFWVVFNFFHASKAKDKSFNIRLEENPGLKSLQLVNRSNIFYRQYELRAQHEEVEVDITLNKFSKFKFNSLLDV